MTMIRNYLLTCVGGAVLIAAAGCADDFKADPSRPRPTRAVESPTERNSASGEMLHTAAISGVPIVEVGLPNTRDQVPKVRTIADNILHPPETTPPTTITTVTPPVGLTVGTPTKQPEAPATRPSVDPLLGPQE